MLSISVKNRESETVCSVYRGPQTGICEVLSPRVSEQGPPGLSVWYGNLPGSWQKKALGGESSPNPITSRKHASFIFKGWVMGAENERVFLASRAKRIRALVLSGH